LSRKAVTKVQAAIIAVIVIVAVIAGAAYYYISAPTPTPTLPPGKAAIYIGFSASETGKWAAAGVQIRDAFVFAANLINAKGGVYVGGKYLPLVLIWYDDASDTTKCVTNYERLITVDKVDFVMGPYGGALNLAVLPVWERYGVLGFFQAVGDELYEYGYKYAFGFYKASSYTVLFVRWMADLLKDPRFPEEYKIHKVACICSDDPSGKYTLIGLERALTSMGVPIEIVYKELIPTGAADLTPYLLNAKAAGAEALVLGTKIDQSMIAARQIESLGLKFKAIWSGGGPTYPAWAELGPTGYYYFSVCWWSPRLKTQGTLLHSKIEWSNEKLVNDFKQAFGYDLDSRGVNAITSIFALADAIERAGTLNTEAVAKALKETKLMTPSGLLVFGPDNSWDERYAPYYLVQYFPDGYYIVYPEKVDATPIAERSIAYPIPAR
jgi:branched-chain amino acid transport system substrate-binding protein